MNNIYNEIKLKTKFYNNNNVFWVVRNAMDEYVKKRKYINKIYKINFHIIFLIIKRFHKFLMKIVL